jgi:Mor family transcriptional regulator
MSYPPRRMLDVWSDRVFDVAKTKAERLLLAALDYAEERYVAYVAEKPPRPWLHTLATRLGRQILYIPLGQIPRRTINRIHTFHVLEGQSVREYAKEYIPV